MAEEELHPKRALREAIKTRLQDLSEKQVAERSRAICHRLLDLEYLRDASHVAVYAAFDGEVDLADLAGALREGGTQLYYPRFNRASRLYEMVAVEDPAADLRLGHWGLLEPAPEAPAVADSVRRLELTWLVPGCAFDGAGHRLGRGGGYYDRMLARTQGMRIGVAFQEQLVETIPVEPHDVAMNMIVTNQQTMVC